MTQDCDTRRLWAKQQSYAFCVDLLEVRGPLAAANPELELPTIACQGECAAASACRELALSMSGRGTTQLRSIPLIQHCERLLQQSRAEHCVLLFGATLVARV